MITGRVDLPVLPFFGVFIAIWATLLLEMWKREECEFRVRSQPRRCGRGVQVSAVCHCAGCLGSNLVQKQRATAPRVPGRAVTRPGDRQAHTILPVSVLCRCSMQSLVLIWLWYCRWYRRLLRSLLSQTVIWLLVGARLIWFGPVFMLWVLLQIGAVVASVIGIFIFRQILIRWSPSLGGFAVGILNGLTSFLNTSLADVCFSFACSPANSNSQLCVRQGVAFPY